MNVTYVGPFAAVEVPSLGLVVEHGQVVAVPDADAKTLLEQPDNWKAADKDPTIAELRALAAERGVDLTGLTKKAEIITKLEEA